MAITRDAKRRNPPWWIVTSSGVPVTEQNQAPALGGTFPRILRTESIHYFFNGCFFVMKRLKKHCTFDNAMQVGLLTFTTIGYLLTAMKMPQY